MAIALTTSGGLFTRWGHLLGCRNDLYSLAGGTATTNILSAGQLVTRYNQFQTDFAASPVWTSLLDGFYSSFVSGLQSGLLSADSDLAGVAANILVSQANQDTPLLQENLQYALQLLQTQMTSNWHVASSSPSAGAQTAVGTPIGNCTVAMSVVRGDGLDLQYLYPEVLTFRCSADQNSGGTLNNETFAVTGQTPALFNWQWPGGSGTSTSLNVVDATASASSNALNAGNGLVNSDFETITHSNIPDNWIALTGTIGTNIFAGATNPYTGSNSMWFTGTAGTAAGVYQLFNTTSSTTLGSGGTPYVITERTVYAYNGWYRTSAAPAAGIFRVALTDASNNILNNDNGTALAGTFLLTSLGTTYTNFSGFFQTPTNLPSGVRLRLDLSTDISNTKSLYLDHLSFTPATCLYGTLPQGPYAAIFSASTPPVVGDTWTVTMSTSMALTTWQGSLQLLLNIAQVQSVTPGLGIRIPVVGGTLINSSLIA